MKSESLKADSFPANQSPLMILSGIADRYEELLAEKGKLLKLQSGARRILFFLYEEDGVSQLTLVRATRLKAPTISLIVQKMERDGLITRRTDEIDMRLTRVYLTDLGRQMSSEMKEAMQEAQVSILKGFSAKETEQLKSFLARMCVNMVDSDTNT